MGLLDLLIDSKASKNSPKAKGGKRHDFVLSKGYRGFKKYHMTVYGDATSEENNRYYFDTVFPGKRISFVEAKYDDRFFLRVLLEGRKIGAIFNEDQVTAMMDEEIEAVYAKSETEVVVGVGSYEERPRIRLFVKYRESVEH